MLDYTLFGESHGPVVGVLIQNIPTGWTVDEAFIAQQLLRRAPHGPLATARHDSNEVEYLSGVFQGHTTGEPLVAILHNKDIRSEDYEQLKWLPRPSHADFTAWVKAHGCNDYRGGGHHSGRLTAPLVIAGGIAQTRLWELGISVTALVVDEADLRHRAAAAKAAGDSVGGQIRCTVTGLAAGWGGADWDAAVESEIARHVFAIPGVKAVGFGVGESFAALRGSEANDALRTDGDRIYTASNHSGGINGGITNGMPVEFTVTFRPTPSIAIEQQTVDINLKQNAALTVTGRHDPCITLRAAPVVEAAAALAVLRVLPTENSLESLRRQLDDIDRDMVMLLERRLDTAGAIGAYKKQHGIPVLDENREAAVLTSRGDWAPEHRKQVEEIYRLLMAQSREEQQ